MRTLTYLIAGIAVAGLFATPVMAGSGAPSGPHYNLNIIGVSKAKQSDMTGSNSHTIFVPLKSTKQGNSVCDDSAVGGNYSGSCTEIVDSKIWLTPGDTFQVCDGNGFDTAYDCSGEPLGNGNLDGATFMLPCNGLINASDGYTCGSNPTADYTVYARALGSPKDNPYATMTTCAEDSSGDYYCSTGNAVLTRNKGKSTYTDVTDALTSMDLLYCASGFATADTCNSGSPVEITLALFSGPDFDWFWNYDNNGLRLAQLRFYEQ